MLFRISATIVYLVVAAVLAGLPIASGQTTAQQPSAPVTAQHEPSANTPGQSAQTKITPQQAKELFREVDTILKFASDDTGLPIKQEVKRKLVDRDEVVSYLQKNMKEDKDAQRLQRSELVLKKFGLLPRDFDLKTFLVALLREQVAGYYDPKTKTVNLLDWLDVEQQRPVLAHELTHALQDQSYGLERWMKAGDVDLNDIKDLKADDVEKDEISDARQAVVEGQAMAVLLDYMLEPLGKSITSSPEMLAVLEDSMLNGTPDTPEFKNAPIFIKESLTFPYRYGLDFAVALLRSGGKEKAFTKALENPPQTTRQIMEPKTYLSGEAISPVRLLDFKNDLKNYERFDIGAMGEFDVALLVDQYAGTEESKEIYPAWRGGYYYAVVPKGKPAGPLGFVYVSRWASAEKADEFAAIYAKSLKDRYQQAHLVAEAGKPAVDLTKTKSLSGAHAWETEEGAVTIHAEGDELLITESLDAATAQKFDDELFAATATAH
jgi:hypothetical protein